MTRILVLLFLLAIESIAHALPVNFGRPTEPLIYKELNSKNFRIYHDHRAPREAQGILRSLEAAQPILQHWLKVKRTEKLPVIISATTSNASFANLLTDSIELQTMGMGGRDLAWHELTHTTMYVHFYNLFGPAGSILHLPWMPAWWIEGLAEALSVSHGSASQANIERWYALTKSWPSYPKLHSLYGKSNFSRQGYAVSGAFVAYLFRQYNANKLPVVMSEFFDYTKPWWWPVTIIPFADFMPMDQALENWTNKNGEELYEEFKKKAQSHWQKRTPKVHRDLLRSIASQARRISTPRSLRYETGKLYQIFADGDENFETPLVFKSPMRFSYGKQSKIVEGDINLPRIVGPKASAYITTETNDDRVTTYKIHTSSSPKVLGKPTIKRQAYISQLFYRNGKIYWLEQSTENTRLCFAKFKSSKATCPIKIKQPSEIAFLGVRQDKDQQGQPFAKEIWLRYSMETLKGNKYRVLVFDTASHSKKSIKLGSGGKPLSVTFQNDQPMLLFSGRTNYGIQQLSQAGSCQSLQLLPTETSQIFSTDQGMVAIARTPGGYAPYLVKGINKTACKPIAPHISPLIAAQGQKTMTLEKATNISNLWQTPSSPTASRQQKSIEESVSTSKETMANVPNKKPRDAKWRGKSLFVFPWIGADGEGNTFGIRSVPLVDDMQTETVQVAALYGLQSKFPDLYLLADSNRFKTHISLAGFNRQTYNGATRTHVLYYKETGAELNFSRYYMNPGISVTYGIKSAYFKPIIGPELFKIEGQEIQLSGQISKTISFTHFSWSNSLGGSSVPEGLNKTWDYNKVRASTSISIPIRLSSQSSTLSLGLSGSRTRGQKMKYLKEIYRPLKTFVPGSGGGLNGTNFPVSGPGALTRSQTGDTQGRAKASWTFPLIPDLETLIGIFYLERLDFTAFFNYGGAWDGPNPDPDFLVAAHGYNLDLSTDIKGITINFGVGVGQVLENDWDLVFKFGFDTLIDIETN